MSQRPAFSYTLHLILVDTIESLIIRRKPSFVAHNDVTFEHEARVFQFEIASSSHCHAVACESAALSVSNSPHAPLPHDEARAMTAT